MSAAESARPGSAEVREHRLTLEGDRSLRVLEAGQGPPVVLIHGALGMAEDMQLALFPALTPRFRVLAVDRPGHGFSRRQRFEVSPGRQADLIREGLSQLGVDQAILVGHSLGGPVALAYARERPEEVRGLVLLAPLSYPEPRPLEHLYLAPRATPWVGPLMSAAAHGTVDPQVLPLIQKAMFAPQDIPAYWAENFPHDLIRRPEQMTVNGEDTADMAGLARLALTYRSIVTPTTILSGDRDGIVSPNRHARALVQALPNARLEMLPGLGHMAHHFAADRVAAAVQALSAG